MIEMAWDEASDTTIVWRVMRDWTWEEFHKAIDNSWDMIHERDLTDPVDLIILMPDQLGFPAGSPFAAIGRGMREIAKQDGIVVVVAVNLYQHSLITMVRHAVALVGTRLHHWTLLASKSLCCTAHPILEPI